MKELRSREYREFTNSRLAYRKYLVKFLRLGLSLLVLAFISFRISMKSYGVFDIFVVPSLLGLHLITSTLVLRKKLESFSSYYLTGILSLFLNAAIDISLSEQGSNLISFFLGIQVGLIFTLIIISKLPIPQLLFCITIFFVNMMVRIYTKPGPPSILSPVLFTVLIVLIAFFQVSQELIELRLWKSLQRSYQHLLSFQKLIENFPSKILVFGPEGCNQLLYMNEEVVSFMIKELGKNSVGDLLKGFRFDSSKTLLEIMVSAEARDSFANKGFEIYFASYNREGIYEKASEIDLKLEVQRKASAKEDIQNRYEIKIGMVKWGNVEGATLVILNDISKSEKIRELNILHENKDKMLATVSHELRTPLNGIIGMIDLASEKIKGVKQVRKYLRVARNSARTLLLMINDILDVSQIEKGTLRLSCENVIIHDAIKKVLPLVKVQAAQKGLALIYENKCLETLTVFADPIRFEQILLNLLTNACKFTNEGGITVQAIPKVSKKKKRSDAKFSFEDFVLESSESCFLKIPSERIESNPEKPLLSDKVVISVEDTGLGISQENLSCLFQLFSKLEQRGNATGVGLGLGISQQLASQMKFGRIKVRSELGKGSKFWFSLKSIDNYKQCNSYVSSGYIRSACSFDTDKLTNENVKDNHNYRIMVTDDDQVNHMVISEYLKNFAFCNFDKAYNGQEALLLFLKNYEIRKKPFDLILMDCNMPIMDGFEATEKIREQERLNDWPRTKIVALTANVSVLDKENYLEKGMDDLWTKPLLKKEFFEKLKSILGFE